MNSIANSRVSQSYTDRFSDGYKRTSEGIIIMATVAAEVRDEYGYQAYIAWLYGEFGLKPTMGDNLLAIHKNLLTPNFGVTDWRQFAPSALYLLAAPSTPDAAREEALERAANGEAITHSAAKEIIRQLHEKVETGDLRPQLAAVVVDAIQRDPENADGIMAEVGKWASTPAPTIPFVPTAADYADFYGDEEEAPPVVDDEDAPRRPANFSSASNEWYTPAKYIDAAREVMGSIDLDPASNYFAQQTVKASEWMGPEHWEYLDGLDFEWAGNVWLNPPYGVVDGESQSGIWARQLINEYDEGRVNQAVLLVNAVTDRVWFQQLWRFPICFTDHRIRFETPDGTPQQPVNGNAFVYLGDRVDVFVRVFSQFGTVARRMEVDNAES